VIQSKFKIEIPFYLTAAVVSSYLLSLFLLQLFGALLVILYFAESWKNKKKAFDIFLVTILIFGVVRLIAIIFSQYPDQSIQSLYKEALFFLTFFAFNFYLKVFDRKKFTYIIYTFGIAAVVISLIGILRFVIGNVDRAQSFSSGYSAFSSYLLAGLGIYIFLFFNTPNSSIDNDKIKYGKIYWVVGVIIILSAIIMSLGRANILIAGLIILSGLIIQKTRLKYFVILIIITVAVSYFSFLKNSSEVTQRIEAPTQLSDRDIIYKGAEQIFWQHPVIGFGPRTFHQIFPNLLKEQFADKGIGSWHNDFLQIYFESGFPGELSFLILIIFPFVIGIKLLRRKGPINFNKQFLLGSMFSLAGLILSAITAGFIDSPVLAIVFGFLISIISRERFVFLHDKDPVH
jgi:O-antigen ligase